VNPSYLVHALERLLREAKLLRDRRPSWEDTGASHLVLDEGHFAEAVSAMPAAVVARKLVAADAAKNGWKGRTLDADALQYTGIVRALAQRARFDLNRSSAEFASYLAGPPRPVEDWVAVRADIPDKRCAVAGGWEFGRFTVNELWNILPLPSIARLIDRRDPFRPDVWSQVAFLRRPADDQSPLKPGDLYLHLGPNRDVDDLWEPLLVLSFWSNHPTAVAGRWIIEPGSAYRAQSQATLDFIPPGWPPTDDEVILADWERLYCAEESNWLWFSTLQAALGERLRALSPGKARRRLEYAARHFLAATSLGSGPGADVWQEEAAKYPELTLEALFRYCSALEGVLGDGAGDLTRKVSQRAAILTTAIFSSSLRFARDDSHTARLASRATLSDPVQVERIVRTAYDARSKFSHGDEPPKDVWAAAPVPYLRAITRAVLLARVILGRDGDSDRLPKMCDKALLSLAARQEIERTIQCFATIVAERAGEEV
jgi:hypothetical protein